MFKKVLLLMMATIVVLSAVGCVGREIVVNPTGGYAPDTSLKEGIEIDWQQVVDDCAEILNEDDYPYGGQISFSTHDEDYSKPVELIWVVGADCPPQDAKEYAKAYVRAFNDAVATQDFNYAFSTEDSYGGFWDKNAADIMVYYNGDELKPEDYIVSQVIEAGSNDPIEISEKYKTQY